MSVYSDAMVAKMVGKSWTYESAVSFAELENLPVRSVISKIKSLGLAYEPKPKAAASAKAVRKSELVRQLAEKLGADPEKLAGLAKADAAAIKMLISAV